MQDSSLWVKKWDERVIRKQEDLVFSAHQAFITVSIFAFIYLFIAAFEKSLNRVWWSCQEFLCCFWKSALKHKGSLGETQKYLFVTWQTKDGRDIAGQTQCRLKAQQWMRDDVWSGDKLLMVWYGREGGEISPGTGCTQVRELLRKNISLAIIGLCESRSFYLLRLQKKMLSEHRYEILKTHREDFQIPEWVGDHIFLRDDRQSVWKLDVARSLSEVQGPVVILVKSQVTQRCWRNQEK